MTEVAEPAPEAPSARFAKWPRWARRFLMLRPAERAYLLGMVMLGIAFLGLLLPLRDPPFNTLAYIAALVLAVALACEAYMVIVRFADAAWAKWLTVPILVMGGALALGMAAGLVNAATAQDPEIFPRAITFLAPMAALPLVAMITIFLSFFAIVAFMLAWGDQLSSRDPAVERRAWFWLWRLFAAICFVAVVSPVVEAKSGFQRSMHQLASWSAAHLDMHRDPICGPREGDRVRRLNDELVVVAREFPTGTVFRRVACPLTAQAPS